MTFPDLPDNELLDWCIAQKLRTAYAIEDNKQQAAQLRILAAAVEKKRRALLKALARPDYAAVAKKTLEAALRSGQTIRCCVRCGAEKHVQHFICQFGILRERCDDCRVVLKVRNKENNALRKKMKQRREAKLKGESPCNFY